jgi:phosphotransferase system enzyme I (PtsI)
MELPKGENPFLGKRALRLCLAEKNLFRTQLRAALRASAFGSLQMMFPMVGSMEDIYRAKECVERAKEELRAEGISFDENMKIGIMIEIPSIALIADLAAEEVDFASVGSNDLTQYVSATDRMNASVTEYYQNYSPAMFRLLGYIFDAFERCGKSVSVCGEMAGNPKAAVVLAGLGAKKFSMSAANMAGVKAALAGVSLEEAKEIALQCKRMKTEEDIKSFLEM